MAAPISPNPNTSLLLLPPASLSYTKTSLRSLYAEPLTNTLKRLTATLPPTDIAALDIILPVPALVRAKHDNGKLYPRQVIFRQTQHLLAGVYALLSVVAAKERVELDGEGGVDARVLLVEWDGTNTVMDPSDQAVATELGGPIVSLKKFAMAGRKYKTLYTCPEGPGSEVWKAYSRLNPHGDSFEKVVFVSGPVDKNKPTPTTAVEEGFKLEGNAWRAHGTVAVGGTFDHLHTGHKLLLTATALMLNHCSTVANPGGAQPRRLIVGITGDELLVNKKHAELLESWEQRELNVIRFLLSILSFKDGVLAEEDVERTVIDKPGVNGKGIYTNIRSANLRIECVKISDPFGPTITDESVSCLVVSGETRDGGRAVNEKRREQGWDDLETFEIDVLDAEDKEEIEEGEEASKTENFAAKISSSAIRERRAAKAKELLKGKRKSPSPSL